MSRAACCHCSCPLQDLAPQIAPSSPRLRAHKQIQTDTPPAPFLAAKHGWTQTLRTAYQSATLTSTFTLFQLLKLTRWRQGGRRWSQPGRRRRPQRGSWQGSCVQEMCMGKQRGKTGAAGHGTTAVRTETGIQATAFLWQHAGPACTPCRHCVAARMWVGRKRGLPLLEGLDVHVGLVGLDNHEDVACRICMCEHAMRQSVPCAMKIRPLGDAGRRQRACALFTRGDLVALALGPLHDLALGHGGGEGGHEDGSRAVGKSSATSGSGSRGLGSGGSRGGSSSVADHDVGDVSPETEQIRAKE